MQTGIGGPLRSNSFHSFSLFHFAALIIFSILAPLSSNAQTVVDAGFETGAPNIGPGEPNTPGAWLGDGSAYVGSTFGISPFEGNQMLQFVHSPEYHVLNLNFYEQVIDLSQFSAAIATGNEVISLSAMFNRVAGDAQTDSIVLMNVVPLSGVPSAYTELDYTPNNENDIHTDSDPATWERLAVDNYRLLPNTTAVRIYLVSGTGGTNGDGHFADDVQVQLGTIPEPTSSLLLTSACGCMLARRRRPAN